MSQSTSCFNALKHWLIGLFCGGLVAYTLATRFLWFYQQNNFDRLLLLILLTFPLSVLFSLVMGNIRMLLAKLSARVWLIGAALATLLTAVGLFVLPYQWPAFPAERTLVVRPICDDRGGEVALTKIERLAYPDAQPIPVLVDEVHLENWQVHGDGFYVNCPINARLSFKEISSGGVVLHFLQGTNAGKVELNWNGWLEQIDLSGSETTGRIVRLTGNPAWGSLSVTWKLLTGLEVLSDFFSIAGLLFAAWVVFLGLWQSRSGVSQWLKFFPLLVSLGVLVNLMTFVAIEQANVYRLRRLPDNHLLTLDENSYDKKKNLPVYLYLLSHAGGQILRAPTGLMADLDLDGRMFVTWSRLTTFEEADYPMQLSGKDADALRTRPHDVLAARSGLPFTYHMFSFPAGVKGVLCMQRYEEEIFVAPADLLPGCGGQP